VSCEFVHGDTKIVVVDTSGGERRGRVERAFTGSMKRRMTR